MDPFCGCATTAVAAERNERQWVGIDIWGEAYNAVIQRLQKERLLAPDGDDGNTDFFMAGQIRLETEPPERRDDGETASPFLRVKQKVKEPEGPKWTRAQMYEHLLDQNGSICQGCDRTFDDPRYLELDHNTPRSDGGHSITYPTASCSAARATGSRATPSRFWACARRTTSAATWRHDLAPLANPLSVTSTA